MKQVFMISQKIFFCCILLISCKKQEKNILNEPVTETAVTNTGCDYFVSTLAGTGIPGYLDGPPVNAQFVYPTGICMKGYYAYVTEPTDQRIRRVSPSGFVSTFTSTPAYFTTFLSPRGICYDPVTNCFYVTDYHRIMKVDSLGNVSIYAGYWYSGYVDDESPARARFNNPEGICVDNAGNLYVADKGNHCIRKISNTGQVTTLAGTGTAGYMNGSGSFAKFNTPYGICYHAGTNSLYVTDMGNYRIRKVQMNGNTAPFAGSGLVGNTDGGTSVASFFTLRGIAVDLSGDLLVVQASGSFLRRISAGIVSTIVPDNGNGFTNGPASQAQFANPNYIVVNNANQYVIADNQNHVVRKLYCQ